MCFHCVCYKRLQYPDDLDFFCCNMRLHVHTFLVTSNILFQNPGRACVVALVWVWLLPGKWEDDGCCGFWFVLLILLGSSTSVPSVVESAACWLIA